MDNVQENDQSEIVSAGIHKSVELADRQAEELPCGKRDITDPVRRFLKTVKLPLLFDWLRWLLIDLYRRLRYGKKPGVFGVYVFAGLHGRGKTLSMVRWIEREKRRVPGLRVFTNFFYEGQDGYVHDWRQMIQIAEVGNAIIAIDEAHTSFNSRSWKDFPSELIDLISQNRKDGTQLLMSAQVFDSLDKVIRDQTHYVVRCRNFGKRLFMNVFYLVTEYSKSEDKRSPSWREWFVASDDMRESYDTFQKIRSLMNYEKQDTVKAEIDVRSSVEVKEVPKRKWWFGRR